jgi:hypothetical protein
MSYFNLFFIFHFSFQTLAQTPGTPPVSPCRQKYFSETDKTKFLTCATNDDFFMPKWCEKMKNYPLVNFLQSAADFVGLQGGMELLSIGMVGEGVSIKDNRRERAHYEKVTDSNFSEIAGAHLTKTGYVMAETGIDKGKWILKNKDGSTNSHDEILREVMIDGYYGDSFFDDGSDTFGLEYNCLRLLGLIPTEFTHGNTSDPKLRETKLSELPDFGFSPLNNPKRFRNEEASRFSPSQTYNSEGIKAGDTCYQDLNLKPELYKNKLKADSSGNVYFKDPPVKRLGDPGRTFYRTPEAQVFANAALWKLSQERLFAFKKELKIDREFSKDELAFWSKAFYNGAQGTQSGAYTMMKLYHSKGILNNEDYLNKWPGIGSTDIYFNARLTQQTLKQTPKECFDSFPQSPSNKTYTRVSDLKTNSNSSTESKTPSVREQ